jgi:hypothetical protein
VATVARQEAEAALEVERNARKATERALRKAVLAGVEAESTFERDWQTIYKMDTTCLQRIGMKTK